MSMNIVVPTVGESVVDARVARWLKQEGDAVSAGEPLVELETDKVDVEVSAPQSGVLERIAHREGADVKIGEVLGTIAEGPAASAPAAPAASAAPTAPAPQAAPAAQAVTSKPPVPAAAAPNGAPVPATPSARKLAREQDVAIASVTPSGPRVTAEDVKKATSAPTTPSATSGSSATSASPAPARPVEARPSAPAPTALPRTDGARTETRVRLSKRRATIARRLVEAQHTAALLTTFNEVDMSAVLALRERHKDAFKARYGVAPGIASFFVKASVAALAAFPKLNAEIQGDEMVLKSYFDIGVAIGAAEGLVVPVLRNAGRLSFAEIEQGIRQFAARANDGTLTIEDLRGGTFSITNGGVYGSLMSTPIVNPPQVGILGLHAIKERPAGVNGQVVLRPMMYVALTYDHRIVDGSDAVRFLVKIKDLIEDPASMVLEG